MLVPNIARTTATVKMKYLGQRGGLRLTILVSLNHSAILLKISRRVPNGHIQPQKNLPKRSVSMRRITAGKRIMGTERAARLARRLRGSERRKSAGISIPFVKLVR